MDGTLDSLSFLPLNLPRGVTSISRSAYDLHMIALWICVAIGVVVFGMIAWAVVFHRRSRGAVAADFRDHTGLEIGWTLAALAVLVLLAVPATKALLHLEDTSQAEVTIKVTGQQWRWRYDYLDEDFGFLSSLDEQSAQAARLDSGIAPASVRNYLLEVDQPLVVPTGRKLRFVLAAGDVIHSWWVPALGFKKDAIPGFVNEIWARIDEPGTYRGQCTELCGVGHGFMPVVLKAVSDAEYRSWVAERKTALAAARSDAARTLGRDELMAQGKAVYERMCLSCHQAGGEGIPKVFAALKGSALANGPVAAHLDRVMNGKPGTAMQAFAAQLSDVEIAAVVTYERNAWGNTAGDLVQPAQVKLARR